MTKFLNSQFIASELYCAQVFFHWAVVVSQHGWSNGRHRAFWPTSSLLRHSFLVEEIIGWVCLPSLTCGLGGGDEKCGGSFDGEVPREGSDDKGAVTTNHVCLPNLYCPWRSFTSLWPASLSLPWARLIPAWFPWRMSPTSGFLWTGLTTHRQPRMDVGGSKIQFYFCFDLILV